MLPLTWRLFKFWNMTSDADAMLTNYILSPTQIPTCIYLETSLRARNKNIVDMSDWSVIIFICKNNVIAENSLAADNCP